MSIQSEITRLETAKADIKAAITEMGVTVPDSAKLENYGGYIRNISKNADTVDGYHIAVTTTATTAAKTITFVTG